MDSATQNSPGDSDSESGQPESLSLSASASTEKGRDHALRVLYSAQKRRIRETNKRRDEILKAQAGQRRRSIAPSESGKRNLGHHEVEVDDIEGGSDMDTRLLRRMTRAMGEAEEETEQVSGSESGKEWGGIKSADLVRFQSHPAVEDMAISMGDTGVLDSDSVSEGASVNNNAASAVQSTASRYLPDHLFAAALAKSRPSNSVRPSRTTPKARSTTKKQRPPHARAKDVVIGTRTLRTLSSSPASTPLPAPGATVAPPRIKKFLANALALQGPGKRNSKSSLRWERRPSHLGVMKRTTGAPITAFARARQH
ncbi:hypothetical protein BJY52DRAFT_1272088 [Lactarius psammicola]|nr:hypothetical protein BJY52DRAFT_1272088 [Lactarius psammicola]